jgi:hypothetical protein
LRRSERFDFARIAVKPEVGKTAGIYERPTSSKWPRIAVAIAVLILTIVAAMFALRFFGGAEAASSSPAIFDPAGERALSYVLYVTPRPESLSGGLARVSP